jgi:hypothetical protein
MYRGATAFLILFLTHPGILFPIPVNGPIYIWARGLFQASWVTVMHSFSEGSRNVIASMTYWGFFLVWVYVRTAIAVAEAGP